MEEIKKSGVTGQIEGIKQPMGYAAVNKDIAVRLHSRGWIVYSLHSGRHKLSSRCARSTISARGLLGKMIDKIARNDSREADCVVVIRGFDENRHPNGSALKLINTWFANAPAIIDWKSCHRATVAMVEKHLEASRYRSQLNTVGCLRGDPGLRSQLVESGKRKRPLHSFDVVRRGWLEASDSAIVPKFVKSESKTQHGFRIRKAIFITVAESAIRASELSGSTPSVKLRGPTVIVEGGCGFGASGSMQMSLLSREPRQYSKSTQLHLTGCA